MRTKEIEVWIEPNQIAGLEPDYTDTITTYTKKCGEPQYRAKLIIKMPERKVEITESQFDEAWDGGYGCTYEGLKRHLKKVLFGEQQ